MGKNGLNWMFLSGTLGASSTLDQSDASGLPDPAPPHKKNLVDLLTCWLVDYLNVRLLAFFVNFAVRINFSENDKENNIIFKTIILKSYGYRL